MVEDAGDKHAGDRSSTRWTALSVELAGLLLMEVRSFAVRAEHGDQIHGTVDRPEPVRCQGTELDGVTWLDDQVLVAEQQPHASIKDVHPVVAVVDAQRLGRFAPSGADPDPAQVQPTGRPRFVSGHMVRSS